MGERFGRGLDGRARLEVEMGLGEVAGIGAGAGDGIVGLDGRDVNEGLGAGVGSLGDAAGVVGFEGLGEAGVVAVFGVTGRPKSGFEEKDTARGGQARAWISRRADRLGLR